MRVHFGGFVFDGETRELRRDDEPVHLTPKAFELLQVLIEQRPRAIRKEELRERLWPDVIVDEANLKNLVAEVRAALGGQTIRTVHRYGYAFAGIVGTTTARFVTPDRVFVLTAGENLIGRDPACSVVLDFTGVLRRHARVRVGADHVVLEDLGSKNGTWKNDRRVTEPVGLDDGDRVRIGAVSMTFRSTPSAESTATEPS